MEYNWYLWHFAHNRLKYVILVLLKCFSVMCLWAAAKVIYIGEKLTNSVENLERKCLSNEFTSYLLNEWLTRLSVWPICSLDMDKKRKDLPTCHSAEMRHFFNDFFQLPQVMLFFFPHFRIFFFNKFSTSIFISAVVLTESSIWLLQLVPAAAVV